MELDILRKEYTPKESLKDSKEECQIPSLDCNNIFSLALPFYIFFLCVTIIYFFQFPACLSILFVFSATVKHETRLQQIKECINTLYVLILHSAVSLYVAKFNF